MSDQLPTVYRLHARTGTGKAQDLVDYLLDRRLVGVGWGAGETRHDWDSYRQAAASEDWYGKVDPSVRALHDADEGSLVWMRDTKGVYLLARIEGPWQYLVGARSAALDLWNARPADIQAVGVDSRVPAKIANAFIAGQTFRRIPGDAARRYTQSLWDELAGNPPSFVPTMEEILRSLLDAQALEDLVAVYLQRVRGYLVLPAARRPDTPAYEYVLRHPGTGRQAVVQVKTGAEPVPLGADALPVGHVDDIFVFSATGQYRGEKAATVTKLDPHALMTFMRDQPLCLPPLVEHWADKARSDGA